MFVRKNSIHFLFVSLFVFTTSCSQKVTSAFSTSQGQTNGGSGSGNGDGTGGTGGGGSTPTPTVTATPYPVGIGTFVVDPIKSPSGTGDTPNGIYRGGDTPKITWTTNGTTNGSVDLYYSKDAGVNWILIPPADRPLSGNFDWTIPNQTIGMDDVGICKGRYKAVIKSTLPAQTVEYKPTGKEFCVDVTAPTLTDAKIYPKDNPSYANDPIKVAPTDPVYIDFTTTDDVGVSPKPAKLYCNQQVGSTLEETEVTSNITQSALGSNKYRIIWNVPANTKCVSTTVKVKDLAGRETESPELKGVEVGSVLPPSGVSVKITSVNPVKGADSSASAPNGFYRSSDTPTITWESAGVETGSVELYLSKDKGNTWKLLKDNLPLTGNTPISFPAETIGFDSDLSRKCKGRVKVIVRSVNPSATKEAIYNTDVCVDNQNPKFTSASVYDPTNKNSTANPIVVKPGKSVNFQYRLSDDIGFAPKAVQLFCVAADGSQKLIGDSLSTSPTTLGTIWVVPEKTDCAKTLLKVTDLAGKEATIELKGVKAEAAADPNSLKLKTFDVTPVKGPNTQTGAPNGIFDTKDKPKVSLETEGSKEGSIDLFYRVLPAMSSETPSVNWINIKKDLPLTSQFDWTLPNESIGMNDKGMCRGQLMARIKSIDPSITKEVIREQTFCVDKDAPAVISAGIYPKNNPNDASAPIIVKPDEYVMIPYVFSDDVGISPTDRTQFYCRPNLLSNTGMVQITTNLSESKNGNSGSLEWKVPAGTKCPFTALKVTDYSGKPTLVILKGVNAEGTIDPGTMSCTPGIDPNDSALLGYYCLNKDFNDISKKQNHLIKGSLNPSYQNKPFNNVQIKADEGFGKAAFFDGRSFAVAKQLQDFPVNDQPRTVMSWIYTDQKSWLSSTNSEVNAPLPNRQSTIFHYGKSFERKKDFGMELCCKEGCKCPTPERPVAVLNTYTWDVDTVTAPSEVSHLSPGIPSAGWWHYAVTYSGSSGKVLSIYVNGKKVTEKTQESLETMMSDLYIGTGEPAWESSEPGKYFVGRLSHFAFLKRALSPDEIKKEVDTTKPSPIVCDPFSTGSQQDHGLKGKINYWNGDSKYEDAKYTLDFYKIGNTGTETASSDLYLNQLNITSREFNQGFPTSNGVLKNNKGENLIEFFGLELESKLMLPKGELTIEKEYRIAFVSDDGVRMQIQNPSGSWSTLLESPTTDPNRVTCSKQTLKFNASTSEGIPLKINFFQGPKNHLGLIMLWKEIDKNNPQSFNDPYCLDEPKVFGVNELFDTANGGSKALPAYTDFLARGWKVIPVDNFFTKNPCAK